MAYEKIECPECGDKYKCLGQHWRHNESHRPELTDYQKEIITGLMMGDGSLNRKDKNPWLQVSMVEKEYLEWLDSVFGCLSLGVKTQFTAEESAKADRKSGFNKNAKAENYQDVYYFSTRSLPELHDFDWYTGSDGKKVWPSDIKLTPTVLTHWYVGDGCWNNKDGRNWISISADNEWGNEEKIDDYFQPTPIQKPSNYTSYNETMDIQFTVEQTKKLFEYMDHPPLGFEYKFPPQQTRE